MPNPEFLNLDDVKPAVKKTVSIAGKKHEMTPPTFGQFIDDMNRIKEMKAKYSKDDNMSEEAAAEIYVELTKRTIQTAFPTIDDDMIAALNIEQIKALKAFIDEEMEAESEEAEDESGNAPAAKQK